jgi:hypothetical protein
LLNNFPPKTRQDKLRVTGKEGGNNLAKQPKDFWKFLGGLNNRSLATFVLSLVAAVSIGIWQPSNRITNSIIVALLGTVIFDNAISNRSLMDELKRELRQWLQETHAGADEMFSRDGHALAHFHEDSESFKGRAMAAISSCRSHVFTVLSESSFDYLNSNLEKFAKVIYQRMKDERRLHVTILYGINLAHPSVSTVAFLEKVRYWERMFTGEFPDRFNVWVTNGEAQLEFSVYDNRSAAIFPSATRSMTLFFDDAPKVANALGQFFTYTLTARKRELHTVDDAIKLCNEWPGRYRPSSTYNTSK